MAGDCNDGFTHREPAPYNWQITNHRGSQLKSFAYILAGALGVGSMAAMAAESSCHYTEQATLPFTNHGALSLVDGQVNDRQVSMLLSTIAIRTALVRAEADRQQLTLSRAPRVAGGESYTAFVKRLAFGTGQLVRANIEVDDVKENANYAAVIGSDVLSQSDLDLALRDKQAKLFHAEGCQDKALAYWDSKALDIPMESAGKHDLRQIFFVEVNGQKLRATISTTSAHSTISQEVAERLGVTPQPSAVAPADGGAEHAGSKPGRKTATFDSFAIGDETIEHPHFVVIDRHVPQYFGWTTLADVVLGRDFLNAHHVLLAVSQQRLYYSYLGGPVFQAE